VSDEPRRPAEPTAAVGCPARHGVEEPRGQHLLPGSRGGRFGRMFGDLPFRDPGDAARAALVDWIDRAGQSQNRANKAIASGYTYLGQFIDHDITFDPTSKLQRDNDPQALVNFRTPRFDLDSLYGSGPKDQPFLYDWRPPRPGAKLLVDRNESGELAPVDLPRNRQGRALVGDARNDENLILSQLHLLFINFHNRVVDWLCDRRDHAHWMEIFEEAQRVVRWHYQWIVTHDFLEKIVGRYMARSVLRPGLRGGPTVELRFFTCDGEPAVPVEFSGAAFRFGHSMIRSAYFLNTRTGSAAVPLFRTPGEGGPDLTGHRRLPAELAIRWEFFFALTDERPNFAMRFDQRLERPLSHLPDGGGVLADLNLRRGHALGLPSGADVARAMSVPELNELELRLDGVADEHARAALMRATPLWYYILREAAQLRAGRQLGPVGGRIVAEVLVGLLQADPHSYLRQWPAWRPELPSVRAGEFTMSDLVRFAQDDPPPAPQDAPELRRALAGD